MISAEELLKPVSEENPCGEDLYYDPTFQELDTLILGKPETQFSPAEDPDWKLLHQRCLELSARSKDLRVATKLCLTSIKMDGILALGESLALVKGLLERYWEPVYPRLDPEDNNDPLYRMNVIAALATPKATFGDPLRFLERIATLPLTKSMHGGRFSLDDVNKSRQPAPAEGNAPASAAEIESAFRDSPPEHLAALHGVIKSSLKTVSEMDEFLTTTVGADKAPNLDLLKDELKQMQKAVTPFVAGAEVMAEVGEPNGEATIAGGAPVPAAKGISGEIQSRQDVKLMLDKICDYYTRTEPASPVPNLLRRALRVSEMDFMSIIKELCPDAESTVRTITGEKEEG